MKKTTIKNTCISTILALSTTACASISDQAGNINAEHYLTDDSTRSTATEKSIINMIGGTWKSDNYGTNLKEAIFAANKAPETRLQGRNEVQDYLKAISNQNCAEFKNASLSTQSNTNFALGSASTVLATAGSLLSPVNTSKALSGTSAAVTGIKSQVSENYYREKAFEIISRAINVRRKALWADIEARRERDLTKASYTYTINNAIADAIEYNNACSLIVGFEELNDSVSAKDASVDEAIDAVTSDATTNPTVSGFIAKK